MFFLFVCLFVCFKKKSPWKVKRLEQSRSTKNRVMVTLHVRLGGKTLVIAMIWGSFPRRSRRGYQSSALPARRKMVVVPGASRDVGKPGRAGSQGTPGKNPAGCHALFQGIFPTQGSNLCLLHCRQILYRLSYEGRSLGWEDPLEKGKVPTPVFWPGEFHGLHSPWSHRVRHD